MSWQTARGYCWARALRMLGERPVGTFAAVLVAALALALAGCAFMVAQAAEPIVSRVPTAEVTAFVAPGTGPAEVKALSARLEAIDGIARVRLITRDQAWADLQRRAGDGQPFAEIKPNPLPDVLVAEFAPRASPAAVEAAVTAIRKQPRIESVQADLDWYRRLLGLVNTTVDLLLPAVATIALLTLVVMVGLVRALAVVPPAELRLLEQIGADGDFIRRPFMYAGAVLLGLAAAGGLGLVAVGRLVANPRLAELGRSFGLEIALVYPPWPLLIAFVAACLLLGAATGSLVAVRQIAQAKRSP